MKKKIILIIPILLIVIVFLFIFIPKEKISTFGIEARVSKVSNVKVGKDTDYRPIGWVRVEGTNIDLPVLQTDNYNSAFPVELEGFSWSLNHDDKFHNHISIMGHNVFNLSSKPKLSDYRFQRFEELMSFIYYDFAKENQYIQLTLDGKEYLYKIFSVDFLSAYYVDILPYADDYSRSNMKDFLQLMKKNSLFEYDVDVDENDKVISLITCTRLFGANSSIDLFVNGRLMRKDEKQVISSIRKNEKYKDIEKKLEGDGKNEETSM